MVIIALITVGSLRSSSAMTVPEVCVRTEHHNQGTDDEGDDCARIFGLENLSAAKQWNSEHKANR
jgi:hypothetical protein